MVLGIEAICSVLGVYDIDTVRAGRAVEGDGI